MSVDQTRRSVYSHSTQYAEALHNYDAQSAKELSFRVGNRLQILNQDGYRFFCRFGGREGYVPVSYFKVIDAQVLDSRLSNPLPDLPRNAVAQVKQSQSVISQASTSSGYQYGIALYDYQAKNQKELSFKAGNRLMILEINTNWWKCQFRGNKGLVPSNYLKLENGDSFIPQQPPNNPAAVAAQNTKTFPTSSGKINHQQLPVGSNQPSYPQQTASSVDAKYIQAIEIFNQGMAFYFQNNTKNITHYFDEAIALYPYDPDFYIYRGHIFLLEGLTNGTISDYHSALLLDPRRADIAAEEQRLRQIYCGHYVERKSTAFSDTVATYEHQLSLGNKSSARATCKEIGRSALKLAKECVELNDYQRVISALDEGLKYYKELKDEGEFLLLKGIALYNINQHKEGLDYLIKAERLILLDLSKSNQDNKIITLENLVLLYKHLGILCSLTKRSEDALQYFEKTLNYYGQLLTIRDSNSSDPKFDARNNSLVCNRDIQIRIHLEQTKLSKNILHANGLENRAYSAYQAGNTALTMQLCQEALTAYSRMPHVYLLQGMAFIRTGQTAQAIQSLEKVIDLGLKAPEIDGLLTALKSVKSNIQAAQSNQNQWLQEIKLILADEVIKVAIQGWNYPNSGLPSYSPVSTNGKMDSSKMKELKRLINDVFEKSNIFDESFNQVQKDRLIYTLARTLQKFFRPDSKKGDYVHFNVGKSEIKKDSSLSQALNDGINEYRKNFPMGNISYVEQQHNCFNIPHIQQQLASVENNLSQLFKLARTPLSQPVSINSSQNSHLPKKMVLSDQDFRSQQNAREEVARNNIGARYKSGRRPQSVPYKPHYESSLFNHENIQTFIDGVGDIIDAYQQGMDQINEIKQGNYP